MPGPSMAARDDDVLLTVDDLHTEFSVPAGTVKAVNGVSFELRRGQTLGVVGESGSGKTVMSRSVMGIGIPSNATVTGSVKLRGTELIGMRGRELRKYWGTEMAMVFQDPMTSLNPVVKIGRQLTEHVRHHYGIGGDEAKGRAIELLRSVRIPEAESRFDAYPHELSGGMRQRVCIAIGLACEPELLFADEPTTALDVTVQHQILNLLVDLQRERAMAIILVTHDLGVVARRADEIAVMYAGRIVEKAPTKTLFRSMRHPYTQGLLWSIPQMSESKHTRLNVIPGRPPDLLNPPSGCSFAPRCPYAQEKCDTEPPPLGDLGDPEHEFACHFPLGTPENARAFEANLAAEKPAAVNIAARPTPAAS